MSVDLSGAACRGLDAELFFPARGESTAEARAVCARCPIQPQCLTIAIGERHGIWANTSPRQRRHLGRQHRARQQLEHELGEAS